jgi:glucose-1-phosphate cytidylyltransferase
MGMRVVILAGGFGTRISEESVFKPKPMIEIGGMPILWHIMKHYSYYGHNDFIICCGYKQEMIKQFFAQYPIVRSDVTFDYGSGERTIHSGKTDDWRVTVVDTGLNTMTGGRLRRVKKYIGDERFMLTYGDGVSDVDIGALIDAHVESGKTATITAISAEQRFGVLGIDDSNHVHSFIEKQDKEPSWINGGFIVFEPEIFDILTGDDCVLEHTPLETLARSGEMFAYKHHGFWQCMDTQRDRVKLESLWDSGDAPWKTWD